ncbi:hypothetical protein QNK12_15235 [Neobacillus cucumis]|nr:hypothetical protein QNK12_15235 [Neobacillus cucumis]
MIDYDLDKEEDILHIHLDFKLGAKFLCPHCALLKLKFTTLQPMIAVETYGFLAVYSSREIGKSKM